MNRFLSKVGALWCLAAVVEAAQPGKFAAPTAAAPLPSGGVGGIGQISLALFVVIAAVFAVAWLTKRLRNVSGVGNNGIEVLAQTSLGAKERAVIVRVGGTRLLLGVTSGQVSLLHTMTDEPAAPREPEQAAPSSRPSFTEMLKKSLGR